MSKSVSVNWDLDCRKRKIGGSGGRAEKWYIGFELELSYALII